MSFELTNAISNISHTLSAISEKQKVVSNNIANAHTPGYTAKSLNFADVLGQTNTPFETGLSMKMGKTIDMTGETGVPVDLQKEMIDMQKNMLFYSMATRRTSTIFNTLRTASQIGR